MVKLNKLTSFVLLFASLILFLPVSGGCGGETTSNTFTELLNLVPAEIAGTTNAEAPVLFTLIDYASYFKENGISNFNTIEELLNQLENKPHEVLLNMPSTGNSFITGYSSYAQYSTITDKYVGYNVGDIDAEILFGAPPREGTAAIGRFDPEATKNALNNQAEWPDWAVSAYTIESYNGVTIHSWGSGFEIHMQTRLMPPHIDMLGRAMPLAVTNKYLFYHPETKTVKQMIDASQQVEKSLADLPEYASLANGLSDLGVYTAVMGDESQTIGPEDYEGDDPGPVLKHFLTFGTGTGRDDKGTYVALVLYHEIDASARANKSLLRQRIEDYAGIAASSGESGYEIITDIQIDVDGKVLRAKLYLESVGLLPDWFFSRHGLLVHE